MARNVASEMARRSFDAIFDRVEGPNHFSADETREVLAGCELGALMLERLWQGANRRLEQGMESTQVTFLWNEFIEVIDRAIQVYDVARARIQAADISPPESAEALAKVEHLSRRVLDQRHQLVALARWLETPPAAITPATLPGAREREAAEGYIDLQTLRARLLSGEGA